MSRTLVLIILILIINSCKGQITKIEPEIVGGPCEDCEATLDYKLLELNPKSIDTLPGFNETNPKLKITGTVYELDGKTPAENVILYIYHTSRDGIYEASKNPIGWERRHGKFRGWLKTDASGKFAFYTFRPAPYPEVQEPEHIHIYVEEANKIPYYIDSYIFMDDPTLKEDDIKSQKNRGGSGLIMLKEQNGILSGHRDIILGMNIPDYGK